MASPGLDLFRSKNFTEHVNKLLEEWHTPGAAVAVLERGACAMRGYGFANRELKKTVQSETLFDIASCSKSFTAAAIALLVADNDKYPHVQWDAKVAKLLPDDFEMPEQSYTDDITIEDVLSHRTGMPRHDLFVSGQRAAKSDTPQSVTRNIRNLPIAASLRSKFMYNNNMYTVASYLVEKLSGQTFADFLKEKLFNPMEMHSTYLQPSAAVEAGLKDQMALNYCWDDDAKVLKQIEWEETPEGQGAGSIYTSVADLINWIRSIMHQESPVSDEVYKDLIRPRIITDPDEDLEEDPSPFSNEMYALGWEIRYYRGCKIIGHDGQISGSGGNMVFVPQHQFGCVVLANSDSASDLGAIIARELIDEVLQVPKEDRKDWSAHSKAETEKYKEKETKGEDLKRELCPEWEGDQPQKIPLSAYTGEYWNTGYRGLKVEIKNDQLFVDATDRTFGFWLTFEHVCTQTTYIAHMRDSSDCDGEEIPAEFRFDNAKVVKMGIKFEGDLEDLIWFHKVDQ